MADDDDFKIKGAAQKTNPQEEHSSTSEASPQEEPDFPEGQVKQASVEESQKTPEQAEDHEQPPDEEKYRWFKCAADESVYGSNQFYYIHADTQESSWTEPNEPFWVFDPVTGKADATGLHVPNQDAGAHDNASQQDPAADWVGYNPKIHGNYDPNADYARFHEAKRAQEAAALQPAAAVPGPQGEYSAAMATNRFTGNVQATGLGPERHSDAAKTSRQMNAFFDVDAAANAHDGRSLKDERKAQKLSKEQVKAFNQARKEKKQKKRLAFYKS